MLVYKIQNTVNQKLYIGQHSTDDLAEYWRWNVWMADHNKTRKPLLFKAIRKYGKAAFVVTPLVVVASKSDLDFYEKACIRIFNTRAPYGYNLTDGGEGCTGYKHTPETLEKLSKAAKGRVFSDETRALWSEQRKGNKSRTGQKRSVAERQKQSQSMRGKQNTLGKQIHTDEHKKQLSERMKGNVWNLGRKHSDETKRKISESQKRRLR